MHNNSLAQTIAFPELEDATAPNFTGDNISVIVSRLLPYVFVLAGVLLLFYLIAGGYQIMLSGGNPKNIEVGRNKVMYALLGFAVVFTAYWVIRLVATALGLETIISIFPMTPIP